MKIILFALIPLILSIGIIPPFPFSEAIEDDQICIDKVWIENTKGKIACVTPSTADKLVQRGWGTILDDISRDNMKKHHGWTTFTGTYDSAPHPKMMQTDDTHNMVMVLPLSDMIYKGIVSYDVTEPIQLISMHGPITDDEKNGQLVWTHPDDGRNIALTVEFPENSMGSWLFTGNAMTIHTLRDETFTTTYSVSYKELELSDTVKSGTLNSIQDPGIGHETHQLAILLPPNEKTYSGLLSYTASEPVQLLTLHGPLGPDEDRGQAIWTSDGETKYALTFYDPESDMGTWVFAGNALAIHTMNEEQFTVSYTVAADLN